MVANFIIDQGIKDGGIYILPVNFGGIKYI
jgi:hypothetical protein